MAKTKPPVKQHRPVAAASAAFNGLQKVQMQQTHEYQGPVPPPEILEGFDRLVPGTAQRLIQLAENESLHRRSLELSVTEANISAQTKQLAIAEYQSKSVFRSDTIGQVFGLILSVSCIAGAVFLAINDKEIAAAALAAIPTAAVIQAFFSKRSQGNQK